MTNLLVRLASKTFLLQAYLVTPLDIYSPSLTSLPGDTDTDMADINEFIHVGRHRWDAFSYDTDPIHDIRSHPQVLPLQLSQQALE
jgi:hypothetical protein